MKKLIIFLITIFSFAIFHQCTKSTIQNNEISSKEINNEFDYNNFINSLKEKGIFLSHEKKINLRSELTGDGCYNPGLGCVRDTITDTISVPGFCDNVFVSVEVWFCVGQPRLIFTNFSALPMGGCDSLWNSWLSLSDDDLDRELDQFDYAASLIVEEIIMKEFCLALGIICPYSAVEAHYYKNMCYQWCVKIISRPGEPILGNIGQVSCGRKCCLRTRTYCYEGNGIFTISNPVFTEIGTSNCGSQPISGNCDGDLIGRCDRTCGKP